VRRSLYEQVGGLDERDLKVAFNDIDLCLKVRQAGYRIVWTPFATLLHDGSASRGVTQKVESASADQKLARERAEGLAFASRWRAELAADPAYSRHFSLRSQQPRVEVEPILCWQPEWRPRPRIAAHPSDYTGCGEYRIVAPMRALNRTGRAQCWEGLRPLSIPELERTQPDAVVFQRPYGRKGRDISTDLEFIARQVKAFRVFELDDLVTQLPPSSPHRKDMPKDMSRRLRNALAAVDRLVVSTEPLAHAYGAWAREVVVMPNSLDPAVWGQLQPARAERARPRVGWTGSISHIGDVQVISGVVRQLAEEVDWVFFGACPPALRPYVKEAHHAVPIAQYPAKLASLDLDLIVVPLEIHPFNEARSSLKLMECGILGYPVVCTDITPYQGPWPVTRVKNRPADWIKAIREAVGDRDALRARGDALRGFVRQHHLLEDAHLDRWLQAWLPAGRTAR
jgi:hypothetical protein